VDDLSSDRDAGLVVLGRTGTADEPTPAAAALLSRWFPGQAATGLPQQVGDWLHSLDNEAARRPTWPLVFEEGGRRLVVRRLQAVRPSDQNVLHVSEHPAGRSRRDLGRLGLSRRQAEVIRLAAEGRSNAEIARDLGLSVRTVEGHMSEALERLGVRSRTAAANLIHQLDMRDGQL
jgi:DNA-binding CsgD family transcriptional regulator